MTKAVKLRHQVGFKMGLRLRPYLVSLLFNSSYEVELIRQL